MIGDRSWKCSNLIALASGLLLHGHNGFLTEERADSAALGNQALYILISRTL